MTNNSAIFKAMRLYIVSRERFSVASDGLSREAGLTPTQLENEVVTALVTLKRIKDESNANPQV